MVEYRLEELATRSGVSARNIRAYRERGLLDPPRREGRSALYSDHHLSQLGTINELLRKGFTSAHIAEFLASTRRGDDLAGTLGLSKAVSIDVDPGSLEARRLLAYGLARVVDGQLTLDPNIAEIVARTFDPRHGVQTILRVSDGIAGLLDELAAAVARALEESVLARLSADDAELPQGGVELRQLIADHRTLGLRVVADQLEDALRRHLVDEASDHFTEPSNGGH